MPRKWLQERGNGSKNGIGTAKAHLTRVQLETFKILSPGSEGQNLAVTVLQGYLAHKKTPSPRILQ